MASNISIEDQKKFIKEYEKLRPDYVAFSELIKTILEYAVNDLGYLAIVQLRAKTVESFANKIIMKDKYTDPIHQVTDLCGGRVIVHFQSQVAAVCEFIKKKFKIDEANSLDQKSKLKVNEFGYRSIHYIIYLKKESVENEDLYNKFKELKAEIQVRTMAEHIWADISHDRIYKTDLKIPEEWKREAARLSAILENADNTFASMAQAIDAVGNVYDLQYETSKAKINVEKLKALAEIQKSRPNEGIKNVMDLITVYNALNLNEEARLLIKEWLVIIKNVPYWEPRLNFERLMLELTSCHETINKVEYDRKVREIINILNKISRLEKRFDKLSNHKLSFLYFRFSCVLQKNPRKQKKTLEVVRKALELMPENPLYITALTECMVKQNVDLAHQTIILFKNTLEKTTIKLEELIDLGIDAIPAWFAIGRCHFFLGNWKGCIKAYSNAVSVITNYQLTSDCCLIDTEITRLEELIEYDPKLADQIILYLNIAMKISDLKTNIKPYSDALIKVQLRQEDFRKPIIIVAGGASMMDTSKVNLYDEYIKELMYEFMGTIISGGTKEGIPGLVGRIKEELNTKKTVEFKLIAYLPGQLPGDANISTCYDTIYETESEEFSAYEILLSWTDIILNGINPSEVIVLGIDGGDIAELEYLIALSLGAKVCLLAYSGRAASDFIQEKRWRDHPNLIQVPEDPLTIWAIVNQKKPTSLTKEEIEKLAPLVHEFYREKRVQELKPAESDINKYKVIMRWKKLDPALQESNRLQVAFYEHILNRVDLGIRKSEKPVLFDIKLQLSKADYDRLAQLEHARWNAERLLEGWRYGPVKDLAKKFSPCIVAWEKLDDAIKPYDYDPVDRIPMMLEKIGYEVYRMGMRTKNVRVRRSVK